jgi:AraC-like DNA-binding protein/tetratricopeptide (TPR) repeat protein
MDGVDRTQPIEAESQRVLPQHVKRALAHMRSNMGDRITLKGLASACAVSERTLLRQFHQFVGLAPLAYLRRLRLNAAKSELACPQNNNAIADIAVRCGFSHLGRFATEYRRLFGEMPSATRQRSRGTNGRQCVALRPSSANAWPKKPSLMIVPLRTETLQEGMEARDLTERLAAILSRMHIASVTLAHPSRFSSVHLQPRNVGTEYCLLGRLTRHDERTRVIIRLVDIATDQHLWGDSFDGSANDPFELQDRVVDGVLCGVVSHITDAEIERAYDKDPRDLGAREVALQAMPHILNSNAMSSQKAITILNRAIDMDPADGVAVALLAFSQFQLVLLYGTEAPATATDAAVRLSQRGLSLDNNDPLVLVASGGVAHWLRRFDEADALLARALAIDPTSAWAWERFGYSQRPCLSSGVKDGGVQLPHREAADRAIAGLKRALQLLGPSISPSNCFHGIASAHVMAGRWEDARVWMHRALAENPDGAWIHRNVFSLAFKTGDWSTMTRSVERMRRAYPHLTVSLSRRKLGGC